MVWCNGIFWHWKLPRSSGSFPEAQKHIPRRTANHGWVPLLAEVDSAVRVDILGSAHQLTRVFFERHDGAETRRFATPAIWWFNHIQSPAIYVVYLQLEFTSRSVCKESTSTLFLQPGVACLTSRCLQMISRQNSLVAGQSAIDRLESLRSMMASTWTKNTQTHKHCSTNWFTGKTLGNRSKRKMANEQLSSIPNPMNCTTDPIHTLMLTNLWDQTHVQCSSSATLWWIILDNAKQA